MARKRPAASDSTPPVLSCIDGGKPDAESPLLTRAEARALLRSAPLTHSQLKACLDGIGDEPQRSA
ncbi:MAG: hypothetical protein QOE11_2683 [Solirubrobacteraceae bacterium]|nr:hypothetical protein [Solirubrobacteraceae bacterium]